MRRKIRARTDTLRRPIAFLLMAAKWLIAQRFGAVRAPAEVPHFAHRVERMFCRLNDFSRIATHYDRLAVDCFTAVHIGAVIALAL